MQFMKATAVALALAVGGLSAPIASPLTASDAEAAQKRVVKKRTVTRRNGNRVVNKRVVIRRPGVRVVGGRYWYRDRYYDYNGALAAGIIGFTAGAVVAGALAQQAQADTVVVAPVVGVPAVYTDAWYDDCDVKYRSFEYETGTFLGYDGERHLCVLP